MRYYPIPVGIAIIKKSTTYVGKDMEEREPSYNVGRNVNCCGHCGESMEVSQKTSELPYDPVIPFLSIYLKKKTQTTNAKSCMHPSVYKQQCLKLQRHGSNPSVRNR